VSTAVLSVGVLALVVLVATVRPVNMGALAFIAAFVVGGLIGGESPKDVVSAFPADIFVVLVGMTYLFAIARSNGTVGWAIDVTFSAVHGRAAAIPWVFFLLSTVLCGIGALSHAVALILMPAGMAIAAAHGVRPVIVAIMVGMGGTAGSFSPLGVLGVIVRGIQVGNGLPIDPHLLFLSSLLFGIAAAGTAALLVRSRTPDHGDAPLRPHRGPGTATAPPTTARPTLAQGTTLAGLAVLVVGALGFGIDIGFLALTIAVVLTLAFPASSGGALKEVSWGIVLLLTGVLTYVGVLQRNGTIEWAGSSVAAVGTPVVAALLICIIGAVVSAFASTTGILAAVVPMTVPLVASGNVSAVGLVAALAISSTLVDVSPFSTGGAIAMANAADDERRNVYRGLLIFAAASAIAGPPLSWALLVASGWF
jgi:di/tricarboxylate transporter